MGDHSGYGDDNERPVHQVSISSFSIAKYQVTYAKWKEVKDWATKNGYKFKSQGCMGGGGVKTDRNHPVTEINWYDVVLWCNAQSEVEGKSPCYYASSNKSTVYRSGSIDLKNNCVDWETDGYRLPTEAEWEYACRAGTITNYNFGDDINNTRTNYLKVKHGTSPVGSYDANSWGLYDMHGNVWEWCWDWYDSEYYKSSPSSDPRGPSSGSDRVYRGGSWNCSAEGLRSAARFHYNPDYSNSYVGFRPVCSQ